MVCENGSGTQLMRAAIIEAADATPVVGLLPRPVPGPGEVLVKVLAAGLNPHDLIVAAGIRRPPPVPYVTGIEGVGQLTDGTRVYFSPGPLPGGSMAEYAAVQDGNITAVPTGLSDADAIGVGAAGITAWLSLAWKGNIRPGESVLIMGATGAVGQVAVQAAKLLGAARVVAAGRNRKILTTLLTRGADDIVVLDDGYEQRLRAVAGGGFDLVIDSLYAAPMHAALLATRPGGRVVNLGMRAGRVVQLSGIALKGRDLLTYSGELADQATARQAHELMMSHVLNGRLVVETSTVPLSGIADAWKRQAGGPGTKLVIVP